MRYTFTCRGHPNIRAEHNRTIEFTKDSYLTERGDCIVGVSADFDPAELRKLSGKIRITVEIGDLSDTFKAYVNPKFDGDREIVFDLEEGDYTVVAMNSDASEGIDMEAVFGIKSSGIIVLIGVVFLFMAVVLLAGGIIMVVFGARSPRPKVPPSVPQQLP